LQERGWDKVRRILICANPDLNYIDGSSVWLKTMVSAMVATGCVEVDFIARSKPCRDELYAQLYMLKELAIIDGTDPRWWNGRKHVRLGMQLMVDLAVQLYKIKPYDVIVVRGFEIAHGLSHFSDMIRKCWLYLTDIPQVISEYTPELRRTMRQLAEWCGLLLCQSEGFVALWQALVTDLDGRKVRLYTPVIPDLPAVVPPMGQRPPVAIYAGKFKRDWMTLEMILGFQSIHATVPGSELVLLGDKFHSDASQPDYPERMRATMENTPGCLWLGAQSRESVQLAMQRARVGLSWRCESLNESLEFSTKLLEYGGAGCSAIINRCSINEKMFGVGYPLYANSFEEFCGKLKLSLCDTGVAQNAADVLRDVAAGHTFSSRVEVLRTWLKHDCEIVQLPRRKIRVLVAGHDLKFFSLLQKKLEETGDFEFAIDLWHGHNAHDEARSRELLNRADVIFCEWCLGNLKWYSHNKLSGQRLVARFHLQEKDLAYLDDARHDNIDHICYVSEFIRRESQRRSSFPISKTSIVSNFLDKDKFTYQKKTSDAFHTLGMIGVAPSRKRLDRALDVLKFLLERDSRYCLRIKGKNPLDYEWLLSRDEELKYYREVFERINSDPLLRYKVIFDPAGDDVNEWFTMVGFILSPSDFESFHMAIGEGLLTGAVPVIWDWEGARDIWGEQWIVRSVEEAGVFIMSGRGNACNAEEVLGRLSPSVVVERWREVIKGGGSDD
jgi:glycosyltransferase involved in cell wall biosynthesis